MSGIKKKLQFTFDLKRLHPLVQGIDKRIPYIWVVSRAFFSKQHRYCYFRLPKCANSTVTKTLAFYDNSIHFDPNDPSGEQTKKHYSNLLATGCITQTSLLKNYFCFTVVRDPYARLLSAYLDRIESKLDARRYDQAREAIRKTQAGQGELNFAGFVEYLEQGGLYADSHWCPQSALLPVDSKQLHFIGKVENLEQDLKHIVDNIFGEGVYNAPQQRSHNKTHALDKLASYYTPELKKRVYHLFEQDFVTFDYLP